MRWKAPNNRKSWIDFPFRTRETNAAKLSRTYTRRVASLYSRLKRVFVVIRSINFFFFSIQIRTDTFPNPITLPHVFENRLCKWMDADVEQQMAICKRRGNHEFVSGFASTRCEHRALSTILTSFFFLFSVDRCIRYIFYGPLPHPNCRKS